MLNPDTPLERLQPFLEAADYVLLMSVFPGYGGQAFIPATLERVAQLKEWIRGRNEAAACCRWTAASTPPTPPC